MTNVIKQLLATLNTRVFPEIEDCAKDGGDEFFTEMHCVQSINH